MQRILIAEDDPILAMIYEITLGEAGFDVLVCRDGVEALDALDAFAPDLVITDFYMPRMTGGELIRAVRKRRGVLTSTLLASAIDPARLREDEWADARLEKPITPAKLLRGVRALEACQAH
ncbi:response regulator [Caulobacter sp. ErkDOM-E]|uniref:response regulator n=1 Tax=Caulobacter sp. ErkDOM-E TaxID=3402778 RepID=UPI003AF6C897